MGKITFLKKCLLGLGLFLSTVTVVVAFQNLDPTITTFVVTDVTCPESLTGAIDITAEGTGTLSFSWNGPFGFTSSEEDIEGLAPGTYHLLITDSANPPDTLKEEFEVKKGLFFIPPEPIEISTTECFWEPGTALSPPQVIASCGDIEISGTVNGEPLPQEFPLGETIISWTATDANGRSQTETQTILVIGGPKPNEEDLRPISSSCSITLTPPTAIDCEGRIVTGTTENLNLTPQNNERTEEITWTFEDRKGNKSTATQLITLYPPIDAILSPTPVSCSGEDDGKIKIIPDGGLEPYTYALGDGPFQDEATFDGLSPGTYSISIKDSTGCISTKEDIEIGEPDPVSFSADYTVEKESCFGAGDGKISLSASITGGSGSYQYYVNNVYHSDEPVLQGLTAGQYYISVRDTNGCPATKQYTISVPGPDKMEAEVIKSDVTCYGGSNGEIIIKNPRGGNDSSYEFMITGGEWVSPPRGEGYTFSGLSAGTYTVRMRDASQTCERILVEDFVISAPEVLEITVEPENTTKYGSATGSATANISGATGDLTYSWRNSQGEEIGTSNTITGLLAGEYSLSVTDGAACTASPVGFVIYDAIEAEIVDDSSCLEPNSKIRTSTFHTLPDLVQGGKGELKYIWDFGEDAVLLEGNEDFSGMGPYTVQFPSEGDRDVKLIITDDGGQGKSVEIVKTHYVGECFQTCEKSSNNFAADPSSFYIGDPAGNRIISGCNEEDEMYLYFEVEKNSNVGSLYISYTYTVQGENGTRSETIDHCFTNEDGKLSAGEKIRINKVGQGENEIKWNCEDLLSVIHTNYRWTQDVDSDCSIFRENQEETTINNMEGAANKAKENGQGNGGDKGNGNGNGGDNGNGGGQNNGGGQQNWCAGSNGFVAVATPIRAYATTTPTCYDLSEGSILINATGGTGNFEYILEKTKNSIGEETNETIVNTGGTPDVFLNLPAGTYTVTINSTEKKVDEDGNEMPRISYTIPDLVVASPKAALKAVLETTPVSCFGQEDGTITITNLEGGAPPYTYSWHASGSSGPSLENLSGGNYTVTITDSLGCTFTETATVEEPMDVTQAEAGDQIITCGFTSTTLRANPAGANEEGNWEILEGDGGAFSDDSSPTSTFSGTAGETYMLEWTISNTNYQGCPTSDTLNIEIKEKCQNLNFDGEDDYIDIGDKEHLDFPESDFSFEAWIKLDNSQSKGTILSKRYGNSTTDGYELYIQPGGVPAFQIEETTLTPNTANSLTHRRWYHLAATVEDSIARLYVDGIEVKEAVIPNPGNSSAPFLIGATHGSSASSYTKPGSHFQGWMEEVRIWNTALNEKQIRFMMNQRIKKATETQPEEGDSNSTALVKGSVIPHPAPGYLEWENLVGYYRLLSEEAKVGDGTTLDRSYNQASGVLKNMDDRQENSAPLPYITKREEEIEGSWDDILPDSSPWKENLGKWDPPNSKGINDEPITWNIVKIRAGDKITSQNRSLTLLGLILDKEIEEEKTKRSTLVITNSNYPSNELNSGYGLTVNKYLELNGILDLEGNSQLIQGEGSILAENSTGHLEVDQQGTPSSFNYNYWSSPVAPVPNGTTYSVGQIMFDGTKSGTNKSKEIRFGRAHTFADSPQRQDPITISEYWINAFYPEADEQNAGQYSAWRPKGSTQDLKLGQGYTMKGSYAIEMEDIVELQEYQNYTFKGFPNNGDINLRIGSDQNYLVGNPYPSAIDADKFIEDNLANVRGKNIFNGSLYFWSHFSGDTHYLSGYVGGYATYNLSGGVRAIANDERINATRERGGEIPRRYIPVGQAFFVNTTLDAAIKNWNSANSRPVEIKGGEIRFRNSQRVFERKDPDRSVFHRPESKEENSKSKKEQDQRKRIWLNFESPLGYDRQLLLTEDQKSSYGFDLGYDAPLIDNAKEDMYWEMQDIGFVIQGVPAFNREQEIFLGLKIDQEEKEFIISIDQLENIPEDFDIHLKDSLKDKTHNLRKAPYKASADPGIIHGRFSLVFLNEKQQEQTETSEKPDEEISEIPEEETSENPGEETSEIPEEESTEKPGEETSEKPEEDLEEEIDIFLDLAYSNRDQQVIITNPDAVPIVEASLYNLNGQKLQEFSDIPLATISKLAISSQPSGVYIIQLETEEGSKSLKFIIN